MGGKNSGRMLWGGFKELNIFLGMETELWRVLGDESIGFQVIFTGVLYYSFEQADKAFRGKEIIGRGVLVIFGEGVF